MGIERLLQFSDTDLLVILREIPNEFLLASTSATEAKIVRQRICESLSITAATVYLDDLSRAKPTAEQRQNADAIISSIVEGLVANRAVHEQTFPVSRKFVS